jgi:hypothetical protein
MDTVQNNYQFYDIPLSKNLDLEVHGLIMGQVPIRITNMKADSVPT